MKRSIATDHDRSGAHVRRRRMRGRRLLRATPSASPASTTTSTAASGGGQAQQSGARRTTTLRIRNSRFGRILVDGNGRAPLPLHARALDEEPLLRAVRDVARPPFYRPRQATRGQRPGRRQARPRAAAATVEQDRDLQRPPALLLRHGPKARGRSPVTTSSSSAAPGSVVNPKGNARLVERPGPSPPHRGERQERPRIAERCEQQRGGVEERDTLRHDAVLLREAVGHVQPDRPATEGALEVELDQHRPLVTAPAQHVRVHVRHRCEQRCDVAAERLRSAVGVGRAAAPCAHPARAAARCRGRRTRRPGFAIPPRTRRPAPPPALAVRWRSAALTPRPVGPSASCCWSESEST